MNDQAIRAKLTDTADRCVKCGLCLPHCPTYGVTQNEAESPRGRIALIQGLAQGALSLSSRLAAHLGSCLECRACEAACPSLVAFGSLMDDARALQNRRSDPLRRWTKQVRLRILSSRWGAGAAAILAKLYRSSGLGPLIEGSGLRIGSHLKAYHRVAMQLDRPQPMSANHASDEAATREVALFLGCVAKTVQPGLPRAACRVLARLGYRTRIPRDQCCCGAMHRHNGFPSQANRLLAQNASAFANLQTLVTASACAVELRAHPQLRDALEICRFLADVEWPQEARLHPLRTRVAVHQPCSHRNVLGNGDAACDLLRRIPHIELASLDGNAYCCGAAGTYLLENPEMSAALLAPKIQHLRELGVGLLVTTNTGCALHLAAGAREAGLDLEVLHPVELIARQLVTGPA